MPGSPWGTAGLCGVPGAPGWSEGSRGCGWQTCIVRAGESVSSQFLGLGGQAAPSPPNMCPPYASSAFPSQHVAPLCVQCFPLPMCAPPHTHPALGLTFRTHMMGFRTQEGCGGQTMLEAAHPLD